MYENNSICFIQGMKTKGEKFGYAFLKYDGTGDAAKSRNCCENSKVIAIVPSMHQTGVSYFHSFALTENFIVFCEYSLQVNLIKYLVGKATNKSLCDAMKMQPQRRTRIHILHRATGEVVRQQYVTEPMFAFHHINAYEQIDPAHGQRTVIVVDICAYDPHVFDIHNWTVQDLLTDRITDGGKLMVFLH